MTKIDLNENLIDINELVSFFNVSLSEINDWINKDIIPSESYIKVGSTYRFQLSSVVEALQNQQSTNSTNKSREKSKGGNEFLKFEDLEISSENGNLKSTFELAKCYEFGKGTEINLEEAFNNYQISALHGFKDAYLDLARCFEEGIGTEVNIQEGNKFRELASKNKKKEYKIGI